MSPGRFTQSAYCQAKEALFAGCLWAGPSYNWAMPSPIYTRAQALPALLQQRIAILDGAMGTMIQRFKLNEAQYRGCLLYTSPSPRDS